MLTSRLNRRQLVIAGGAAVAATPLLSRLSVSAQDSITVTMVTDTAGIGDQSFNDMANAGGLRAQDELGITFNVLESQTAADYVRNLTDAAESSDMSIGVGFLLTDALAEVAAQYPDGKFALIDSVVEADNVVNFLFREQEGAFLAGAIAALVSKTGQIGFVGGIRIPPVMRYEVGYVAGAKSVNPDIQIAIAYADDFENPDKGKELTLAQYNNGADVVHAAAGRTGVGAFDAALEKGEGFWVIAADKDQAHLGPDAQLAAVIKGIDTAVFDGIKSVQDGTFVGGIHNLGIADDGMGLGAIHASIGADVTDVIDAYSAAIAGGAIVPPVDDDTLAAFELVSPDAIPAGEATPAS
ncbi:MAG: BMP family ABC transporter substrate-binding protein [Thermomicrobiales bacterium]|nr:BMP family ABC transporter substrate-binding protein [Thermomicrobiales bacterium]